MSPSRADSRRANSQAVDCTIDVEKIQRAITADPARLGICPAFANIRPQFEIHAYATLPSTNIQLWHLLGKGAGSGTVVIAQQQSAGKGQRHRSWHSEPGGLYLSLALEPDWPVSRSPLLTCLSAWGIATALNNLGISVEIKWPNDIFYKGKKLGGILTETKLSHTPSIGADAAAMPIPKGTSEGAIAHIKQAVIGVGINWHNTPPKNGINLARILEIEETSGKIDKNKINCLEVLIALVLRGMLQGYFFQQQVGSQDFMKAYQKLLTQVGHSVSLGSSGQLSLATPIGCWPEISPAQVHRWANRSGEVVGVSEEGYLQVAMHDLDFDASTSGSSIHRGHCSDSTTDSTTNVSTTDILLLKPSEIYTS